MLLTSFALATALDKFLFSKQKSSQSASMQLQIAMNVVYDVMMQCLPEVESRTQGSRPRTQQKSEAKDSLSEDRPSRGQGQECSRPRTKNTAASVLQKKSSLKKLFRQSPIYRRSQNFWLGRLKPQITCNDVIKNLPVFYLTRILQRERA